MTSKKLSIITVCYNASDLLRVTLESVRKVKSDLIEYVVIDGASKDSSSKILSEYKEIIDVFISEPDKGIYDAMNKGIAKASGEYLLFINAGDEILERPLKRIFEETITADIIYGDALYVDDSRAELGLRSEFTSRSLPKELTLSSYKMGQRVSHQSFIVKKSIAPFYDLKYRISADYDWMLHCIKQSKSSFNLEEPVSIFLHGGVSKQQIKKTLKERFQIMRKHFGLAETLSSHLAIFLRGLKFYQSNKRVD